MNQNFSKISIIFFLFSLLAINKVNGLAVGDSIVQKENLIDRAFNLADKILDGLNGERWSFIPVVTYSPETNLGFGGRAIMIFKDAASDPLQVRPSTLPITFLYTLNHQTLLTVEYDSWQQNNKKHLYSRLEVINYPFKFYGTGNAALQENEEHYASKYINFVLSHEWRIGHAIYIGPQYHFRLEDVYEVESEGLLSYGTYLGSNGQRLSGAGILFDYDTRDNIFQPTKGTWIDISMMAYHKFLGSEYGFMSYKLDVRKYKRVFRKQVLAFQGLFNFTQGDVTFQNLAFLGGPDMMRGFFEGYYRDRHAMAFQLEYRTPVYRKLGIVFYGGGGQVANQFQNFDIKGFHYGGGMGFRYQFGNSGLNIRLDLAYGNQRAMYFGLNEAF